MTFYKVNDIPITFREILKILNGWKGPKKQTKMSRRKAKIFTTNKKIPNTLVSNELHRYCNPKSKMLA